MVSKLQAVINKKVNIPIKETDTVLYLGASHGITPEIIAKKFAEKGFVFCVEISRDVAKKLLEKCEKNKNMAPLIFDANRPKEYQDKILKPDVIYQDITQKNQVDIFLKNISMFLKQKGYAILALKTKSIDSVKNKEKVLKQVKKQLEKELEIISITDLEPYHKDHYFIICKKR